VSGFVMISAILLMAVFAVLSQDVTLRWLQVVCTVLCVLIALVIIGVVIVYGSVLIGV
jgi:hypothetical protein